MIKVLAGILLQCVPVSKLLQVLEKSSLQLRTLDRVLAAWLLPGALSILILRKGSLGGDRSLTDNMREQDRAVPSLTVPACRIPLLKPHCTPSPHTPVEESSG